MRLYRQWMVSSQGPNDVMRCIWCDKVRQAKRITYLVDADWMSARRTLHESSIKFLKMWHRDSKTWNSLSESNLNPSWLSEWNNVSPARPANPQIMFSSFHRWKALRQIKSGLKLCSLGFINLWNDRSIIFCFCLQPPSKLNISPLIPSKDPSSGKHNDLRCAVLFLSVNGNV